MQNGKWKMENVGTALQFIIYNFIFHFQFSIFHSLINSNLTVKQMLCFAFTLTNKQKRGKMYNCKIL